MKDIGKIKEKNIDIKYRIFNSYYGAFIKKTFLFFVIAIMGMNLSYSQKFIRPETTKPAGSLTEGIRGTLGPNQQISLDNQITNMAAINGLLVGYGFYCSINQENVKVLHSKYFETVGRITDEGYKKMATQEYESKVKLAREKGPSYSGTNCEYVVGEYKKIMNMISKNTDQLFENNGVVIRKKKD